MPVSLSGSLLITGSLTVTEGIIMSGSIASASFATNASLLNGTGSGDFTSVNSFNSYTSSTDTKIASINTTTGSQNTRLSALETASGSAITRLGALETASGSAITRLSSLENRTGSYATTGSNTFIGTQTITGSLLQSGNYTTTGTITAQTINVQQVTSSIVYSCGSNNFGTAIGNTQVFTGSMFITGSNIVANIGNACFAGSVCSPSFVGGTVNGTTSTFVSGIISGTPANTSSLLLENFNGDQTATTLRLKSGRADVFYHMQAFSSNTSEVFRIEASGRVVSAAGACFSSTVCAPVAIFSGCVGIGTTSPSDLLDIYASSGTAAIRLSGAGAGTNTYRITGQLIGVSNTGFGIYDSTNSTYRLAIDGSGNVGIGTSSPTELLSVNSSSNVAVRVENTSTGTARLQLVNNDGSTNNNNWSILAGFGNTRNLSFRDNLGGERMRLDASGNLGLGVTPSAWASGWSAIDLGSYSSLVSGFDNTRIYSNGYNGSGGDLYKATGAATVYTQTGGQHIWYNAPSGTAGNAISFTQAMTLDACGRLGIGITSPNAPLTLQANSGGVGIHIVGRSADGFGFLTFRNNANNAINGEIGISDAQNMLFYTGASVKLTIASTGIACFACQVCMPMLLASGCVGIGTTSPDSLLHVLNCSNAPYNDANTLVSGQWFRMSNPSTCTGAASGIMFVAQGPGGGNGLATINGVTTSCGSMAITFGTRNTSGNVTERMRIGSCGLTKFQLTPSSLSKTNMSCFSSGYVYLGNFQGVTNEEVGLFGGNDPGSLSAGMGIYRESSSNWAIGLRFYTHVSSTGVGVSDLNRALDISGDGIACFQNIVCMPILLASGCVGIGTTNPTSKLFIAAAENQSTLNAGANAHLVLNSYQISGQGPDMALGIAQIGGPYGYIQMRNPVVGGYSYNLVLNPSGGNVGIGTTSPTSLLHIYSSASSNVTQKLEQSSTFGAFQIINNASSTLYVGVNNSAGSLFGGTGGAYGGAISMDNAYALGFATNNTERMRITSTGIACFACQICAPSAIINGTFGLANGSFRTYGGTGDLTINVSNLPALDGNIWRTANGFISYSGVQTDQATQTDLFAMFRLRGLSCWNEICVFNIVGSTTLNLSNGSTTCITLTLDVNNSVVGSALVSVSNSNSATLS
jgi:hypothetical protein